MAPHEREDLEEKLPPAVNNRGLFSDYYLTTLVWEDPFFSGSRKEAEWAWLAIKSQYERVKGQLPSANEAQVEHLFVRPVLDALGYKECYAVQPAVPSPEGEGPRRPDYAFFANPEDLAAAETKAKGKVEYFTKALAIGDAKAWDQSLDRKGKGGGFTNANPSYQIDYYLRVTDRKWGILTNGRRWRLYHRDTSYRMNVFYEVDLVALLESYNESFLYFFAFFSKEALTTGFVDRAITQSREYTATVGRELKDNVYEALRLLAEGLLKCPDNHLTADHLEKIRENTFVLIYRILFLFYAEDRGLLPLENPDYRESYSLRNLAKDIAQKLDQGHVFSPTAYGLWAKLTELFRIVNEGDAWLGVPPYNGGLFDPDKHPDLARWKVGDHYIARAIDQLARVQAAGRTGRGPVNYRDLDIRDLGSIYEGLLEHRLRLATRDTAVVKDEDHEVFVPLEKLGNRLPLRIYRVGEVYLETDKGERKATGSYYTPDYIVRYIVEHTLGPLIEEKKRKVEEERKKLEEELKRAQGQDREQYERKLQELEGRLIEEILSLKVLDPAMGSGHFLVGAMDFLARALIEALGGAPEESDEEDIRWARREVVERCLYGVDLNPLAVELAKLSLWIYTAAKDRPLSFLDHHLRVGNSLIGAWVKDLGRLPAKGKKDKAAVIGEHVVGLFEGKLKERLPVVLGEVMELLRKPSDRVEDIREKETIYNRILELLRPFKEVADVWTATWFGVEVSETEYEDMLLKLAEAPHVWEQEIRSKAWFQRAVKEATRRQFFHWELEFPEVFFDMLGRRGLNAGFDVVIGNPPWVSFSGREKKAITTEERVYFAANYRCFSGWAALHTIFGERAFSLLSERGFHSFIVPDQVGYLQNYKAFRKLFTGDPKTGGSFLTLANYTGEAVFEGVVSPTMVYVVSKRPNSEVLIIDRKKREKKINYLTIVEDPDCKWTFGPTTLLLDKVREISITFNEEFGDPGVHTGNCSQKLILKKPVGRCAPILEGKDIDRYNIPQSRLYLRLDYTPDANEYFTIREQAVYQRTKLLIRQTAPYPIATVHTGHFFRNSLLAFFGHACLSPQYVLALINSKLMRTLYQEMFVESAQEAFPQIKVAYLRRLPFRRIAFVTRDEERRALVREAIQLYQKELEARLEGAVAAETFSCFLRFVEERLRKVHQPDTELVQKHNADPLNKDWQIPEGALWEQSDVVHDILVFLAEEMIRLNKEKQAEMRKFLSWLETELQVRPDRSGNIGIEALTGKNQLKNYLGDYQKNEPELSFEELWQILQKNKSRIGRRLTYEFMAELREAYEQSLAKLRPIKERLRLTDGLIDQIVYRLYGLTEEERAIVEEAWSKFPGSVGRGTAGDGDERD